MLLIRNSLINVSDIADVKGEEKMTDFKDWLGQHIVLIIFVLIAFTIGFLMIHPITK